MAQGDLSDSDPFFNLDDDALHYCVNRLLCLTQLHSFSNDWHRGILLAQDPLKYQTWKTIDRTESSGPPYCGWPRELKPSSQTIPTVQPDAADPSSQKEQRERQEKRIEIFKDEKRYLVGETGPHTETRGPTNGWLKELRYTLGIYFNQPWTVHALVACCCIGGAVQGWDEAAVNGAQVFYKSDLGLAGQTTKLGLINGAPYAASFVSCLLTEPLNSILGRRGTILFACFWAFIASLGQAFVGNWRQLLACRILLGLEIGPKTVTIPIYAAESVDERIRGALVAQWQLWDACGILLGNIACFIFHKRSEGWRIMLASPMIPALLLFILMMAMPESPRWLLFRVHIESKNDLLRRRYYYERAFRSLDFLRPTRLQAARDLLQHHAYIEKQMARLRNDDAEVEESTSSSTPSETDQVEAHNKAPGAATDRQDENLARPTPSVPSQSANERHHVSDRTELFSFASHTWGHHFASSFRKVSTLFTNPRCRAALNASLIVMSWQQLCGINVLAYYSTPMFLNPENPFALSNPATQAQFGRSSFVAAIGVGLMNFFMTIPALLVIDSVGRRRLLLYTFPCMAICYFVAAASFSVPDVLAQKRLFMAACYLFVFGYSLGEGPVPLVYASEVFPLGVRDTGVGFVTAWYWAFNFTVAITWPRMYGHKPLHHGLWFGFYAVLCLIGWVLIYLVVPETKVRRLENLDMVFQTSTRKRALVNARRVLWWQPRPSRANEEPEWQTSDTEVQRMAYEATK